MMLIWILQLSCRFLEQPSTCAWWVSWYGPSMARNHYTLTKIQSPFPLGGRSTPKWLKGLHWGFFTRRDWKYFSNTCEPFDQCLDKKPLFKFSDNFLSPFFHNQHFIVEKMKSVSFIQMGLRIVILSIFHYYLLKIFQFWVFSYFM
jgi:hypothetical protein